MMMGLMMNRKSLLAKWLSPPMLVACAVTAFTDPDWFWKIYYVALCGVWMFLIQKEWKVVRYLDSCMVGPRLYGVAWRTYHRDGAYIAPVPLNIIIGVLYDAWQFMRYGWRRMPLSPWAAYAQGKADERERIMKMRYPDCECCRLTDFRKT